jgi:hypothetical protein
MRVSLRRLVSISYASWLRSGMSIHVISEKTCLLHPASRFVAVILSLAETYVVLLVAAYGMRMHY